MSYYVVRNKFRIPRFLFVLVASWVLVWVEFFIVCLLIVVYTLATGHSGDLSNFLPWPVIAILGLSGAYAAIAAVCLYVTMWVYWIGFDRSSVLERIGWLVALLVGLNFGALMYAIVVWKTEVKKVDESRPIRGVPYLDS